MNWLFIFWIFLFKHVICEESRISDLRLCADPKCTEPVSEGRTLITYNSDDSRILSFRRNVPVLIYSKSAGKNPDLWGAKIEGKRGYVPRGLIRENRIIKSKKYLKYKVPTEIGAEVIEVPQDSIAVTNNDSNAVDATLLPSDAVSEAFPSQTEPLTLSSKETVYSGFLIKGAYAEPQHAPDPNTVAKPYDVIDGTTFYGEEYSNLETSTIPSVTTQPDIKPTIAVGIPEVQSFPSDHMTKTLTEDAFSSKGPDVNLEDIEVEQNILQSTTEKILEFFSGHSTEENVQKDEPSVELQPSPSEGEINVSTHENMENNTPVHNDSELTTGQNTETTNSDSKEFEGYSSRKLLEDQVFSDKIEEASSEDISISTDDIGAIVDAEEDPEDDEEEEEDEYEDEEDVSEEEDETNDSGVNAAEQNIEMRSDKLSVNSKFTEPQEENSVPVIPAPHVIENIPVDDAKPAVIDENKYVTLNKGDSVSSSLPEISPDTNVKIETSDIQNVDTNNTANSNSEISQENLEQKQDGMELSTVPGDQKVTIETQHNNIEQQFVTSGQQHSVASSEQTSIQQEGESTTEHILQPAIDIFSEAVDRYANVAQPEQEKVLIVQDHVYTSVSDHNEKLTSDKISDNTNEGSSEIDIPKEEATTENININSNPDIVVDVASKSDSDTVPISSENGEQEINIVKDAETSAEHNQEFSTEPNWVDSSDVIPPTNLDDISEDSKYISEVSTEEPAVSKVISSQPKENVHENVVDSSSETDSLSYDPIDSSKNLARDNETPSEGFFTNIYYMIFGGPSTLDDTGEDITISETVNEDLKTDNDVLDSIGISGESAEIMKETVVSSSVKKDDSTGSQTASTCHAASQLGSTEVDSQCSDLERDMNEASNKLHGHTEMPVGHFDFTSVLMDIQPPSIEMIVYVSITGVFVLLFTLGHYYLEKRSRDGTLISKLNALEKELMMSSKECVTLKDELKVTKEKLVNVEHVSLDSNTCVTDLQTELEECKPFQAKEDLMMNNLFTLKVL